MPTATFTTSTTTATTTPANFIPLKAGHPSSPSSASPATAATLRSLYNRAARAFLHRDISQTHSLLKSAFSILTPPATPVVDALADHRRKWDILRITLETTVYAVPPSEVEGLPDDLKNILVMSPQLLIGKLYERSLVLFTSQQQKPNSASLPSQVLITLVLSSMKLDCPDIGRTMIEDWLARRGQAQDMVDTKDGEEDGYEKVLDMYCLHILPRLEEWDYAKEFLSYESELPHNKREHLVSSLQKVYIETMEARLPPSPSRSATPKPMLTSSPRSGSPTPSSTSSTSFSTTSTRTAVPHTPRPHTLDPHTFSGMTPSASTSSVASDATVTKRSSSRQRAHGETRENGGPGTSDSTATSTSSHVSTSSVIRPPRSHPLEPPSSTPRPPSTLALIRASLSPYMFNSRMGTLLILFVLIPVLSLLLRLRRRQRVVGGSTSGAADAVRRRLAANQGAQGGLLARAWGEVVRAVGDTVRMGGSGLV